jgi:hypothetical protein
MQVTQVDERDSGWEDLHPRFRVYLHGSSETTTGGWTDTYDITGADVLQVIDRAQRQARDRLTSAVTLVRDDAEMERLNPGHGRGLVWLVGMDGNDNTDEERLVQQRMLARRRFPSGYPRQTRPPTTPAVPTRTAPHHARERTASGQRQIRLTDPERLDQLLHPPRRDTQQVAGGHHRGQRPLGTPTPLEQPVGEVGPLPQLRDRNGHSAGPVSKSRIR